MEIVSGTEKAHQTTKPNKEELEFQKRWQKQKEEYISKHTTKDMVYENGSALALLYKEVTRLNQLITTYLQNDSKEKTNEKDS